MQVFLTETLEAYVRDRVASGLYGDASEVIRAALRAQIDIGWAKAERGAFVPFDPDQIGRDAEIETGLAPQSCSAVVWSASSVR